MVLSACRYTSESQIRLPVVEGNTADHQSVGVSPSNGRQSAKANRFPVFFGQVGYLPGTVRHYLFAAVRNEALNTIRHQQVVKEKEEELSRIFTELKTATPDSEDPETKSLRKNIERAVDQLPSRCQQIFMLNRRSGLTYEEIADFLDISINTVGTQMGRALKSLRDHLSDYVPLLAAGELSMMVYQILLTLLLVLWATFG